MTKRDDLLREIALLDEADLDQVSRLLGAWQRAKRSPFAYIEELMQFEFLEYDPQKETRLYQMSITDELKNRMKTVHGGIIATFIDTAIGATVFMELGQDSQAVTLDLSVHYLSPGKKGKLCCETHVVKTGKTILVIEAKVYDEQEKLIATASATFYRMK